MIKTEIKTVCNKKKTLGSCFVAVLTDGDAYFLGLNEKGAK